MWRSRVLRAGPCLLASGFSIALSSCNDSTPTAPVPPNPLDPTTAPHVVATYPPAGEIGPFELNTHGNQQQPHFVVLFDKLIDRHRYASDWFRVEGFARASRLELVDGYSWPQYADLLAVRVLAQQDYSNQFYEIGGTYTVTVDTTLSDLTGNHLDAAYRFSFVPEPFFRIVTVRFSNVESVWPLEYPQIQFNAEVDPASLASIHLEPDVPGTWVEHKDPSAVGFGHTQPFEFDTVYTLRVAETAKDLQGHPLPEPFSTTFHVRAFEIEGNSPPNGSNFVPPNEDIGIQTSGPVDTTSLSQAFEIEPALSGRFIAGPSTFYFDPNDDLQPATLYHIRISTALRAWDGTPLASPYDFAFTTADFSVTGSDPWNGSTGVPVDRAVTVFFTMRIDASSLAAAFSMLPQVLGSFELTTEERAVVFTPNAPLAPATEYSVTISTALRAHNGAAFPQPYNFTFTTASP